MKHWFGVAFAALAALPLALHAQGYPSKPVTAVITFTPGSATDIVGRIVMARVSEFWGQPVVVENKPGAGGSIASGQVARAAADGYTLLINSNAHAVNPAIIANLPYDTLKDFIDVVPLALQPNVLVSSASSPLKSVADVVSTAKAKPGAINFGSAGVGSGTHLNLEKFVDAAGIKVTHVPYKGTPEVVTGLLNGSVDLYWAPVSAILSNVSAGKLQALAVSTSTRSGRLPNVPTTGEAGVPNADAPLWFGVWVPAGTPKAVVDRINADVRRAIASPDVKEKLANLGNEPVDMTPDQFAKFVRDEMNTYGRIIRAAGIKPQ
jgi:tripartite-type tricarboxylate transporter receptor subunit TctC